MTAREKQLEEVVRYSIDQFFGGESRVQKRHQDMYTGAGDADFHGHLQGLHFEMELKVAKNYFTPVQQRSLVDWHDSGALAFGCLWDPEKDWYYLILAEAFRKGFSYRDKSLWMVLPQVPNTSRTLLNLTMLKALVVGHRARIWRS